MTNIIFTCPAYDIISDTTREFVDGDEIAIPYQSRNHGTLYNFYRLGSVAGYAARYGDDVQASIERAIEDGHDLFYAYGTGTLITAERQARKAVVGFEHGDIIKFAGLSFRIDPANNNNISLTLIS